MSFSFKDRQEALASLPANVPELVIIGAGVVGCSIAAHAAHLGLNVLVIEKEDIAYGASGNSTGWRMPDFAIWRKDASATSFAKAANVSGFKSSRRNMYGHLILFCRSIKEDPYPFWMVRLGTFIYDVLGWIDALVTKRPLVRRHSSSLSRRP